MDEGMASFIFLCTRRGDLEDLGAVCTFTVAPCTTIKAPLPVTDGATWESSAEEERWYGLWSQTALRLVAHAGHLPCESGAITYPQGGQGALNYMETHVEYSGQFLAQRKPSITVSSLPPLFPFKHCRSDVGLKLRKLNNSPACQEHTASKALFPSLV